MTLSPVFRSNEAVRALTAAGVWTRLEPASQGQAQAISTVTRDLVNVLDPRFVDVGATSVGYDDPVGIEFVQEFFFLILFRSILQTVGVSATDLALCSELNFCIKGTITAADNLFDDQDKRLLPLKVGQGARFHSILQMLAFERLCARALGRGVRVGSITERSVQQFQLELLSRMASIGSLEGSEEGGITGVLDPDTMIDRVHRVRGGALFELAFVAPRLLNTTAADESILGKAQGAISRLGTAFQIVDDLTDFEVDVTRGSHNLLVAQIAHSGSRDEQRYLANLGNFVGAAGDVVTEHFSESARAVLVRGQIEARAALEQLHKLGFWFPLELSDQLVRAIVGLEGVERMRAL